MYGYNNYKKVKDELDTRRANAETLSEIHTEEVWAKSPEIKKIDLELRSTGLRIFEAARRGESLEPIKKRNLELNKRRTELMLSLGYPDDYTDVNYSCKLCKDTGVTVNGTCTCFKQALIKENIKSSGIGALIDTQSFDNFSLAGFTGEEAEIMKYTLEKAKEYANSFAKGAKNLLLVGTTGTGKTHISTAIAKTVIERGYEVIYDTVGNIISEFNHDQFRSGHGESPRAEKYLECELLILDDLGTEFATPFSVSCIYNLINTRLNRDLPTIISTNLMPKMIREQYDDRISSRILGKDTIILRFVGQDKRLYK